MSRSYQRAQFEGRMVPSIFRLALTNSNEAKSAGYPSPTAEFAPRAAAEKRDSAVGSASKKSLPSTLSERSTCEKVPAVIRDVRPGEMWSDDAFRVRYIACTCLDCFLVTRGSVKAGGSLGWCGSQLGSTNRKCNYFNLHLTLGPDARRNANSRSPLSK